MATAKGDLELLKSLIPQLSPTTTTNYGQFLLISMRNCHLHIIEFIYKYYLRDTDDLDRFSFYWNLTIQKKDEKATLDILSALLVHFN